MPAGRQWTVSIGVSSSVIDNTQNTEFATYVAGQIARAAAIFNVDEVCMLLLLPPCTCSWTSLTPDNLMTTSMQVLQLASILQTYIARF